MLYKLSIILGNVKQTMSHMLMNYQKNNFFISSKHTTVPSSSHLTDKINAGRACIGAHVMTRASLLLTFSISAARRKGGKMEQVLSVESGTPQGCSPLLHPLSPSPTVRQRDYSGPRGETSSRQAPQSPAG